MKQCDILLEQVEAEKCCEGCVFDSKKGCLAEQFLMDDFATACISKGHNNLVWKIVKSVINSKQEGNHVSTV